MRALAWMMIVGVLGCRSSAGSDGPARTKAPDGAASVEEPSDEPAGSPVLETDAAADQKVALAEGVAAKVDTIEAAHELANTAADGLLGGPGERLATPALVSTWPSGRALVFVIYPLASSKAGMNRFKVGAPVEVTVDLVEGTTKQRKLRRSAVMDEIEVGRDTATVRQNLATAEQTLLELLLERRTTARSLALLDGYREWFNHHLDVMTDLDKRMPKGIRWLREPQAEAE